MLLKRPYVARVAVWVDSGDLSPATLFGVAVKNSLAAVIASDDQYAVGAAIQYRRLNGNHDAVKSRAGQNVRPIKVGTCPDVAFGTVAA